MAVDLYVWTPSFKSDGSYMVGHAALWIDAGSGSSGVYYSVWPSSQNVIWCPGGRVPYLDDYTSQADRTPNIMRFTKLDQAAMKDYIKKLKLLYSLPLQNCSTFVGLVLNEGRRKLEREFHRPLTWSFCKTPMNVWIYASTQLYMYK